MSICAFNLYNKEQTQIEESQLLYLQKDEARCVLFYLYVVTLYYLISNLNRCIFTSQIISDIEYINITLDLRKHWNFSEFIELQNTMYKPINA